VVTEKGTDLIDTYTVEDDGLAAGPVSHPSHGHTPFGFAFARGQFLVVSEFQNSVFMGATASSYKVSDDGGLRVVSGSVPDYGTAACWSVVSRGGRFAYISNPDGSISGYSVSKNGTLTLLNADGKTAVPGFGSTPIDMAVSKRGRFLYVQLVFAGSIAGYRIEPNGSLAQVTNMNGIPLRAEGIAAW
jgi:6-phosphogluconolactonase (cycloisomerase 2 family)